MPNTYHNVSAKANSKDCSVQEFRDILWQYVEDEMKKYLKSGNVDTQLVKTLINYHGNSYGAHAMLLDMGFGSLYENTRALIYVYAVAHEDSCKNTHYYYCFEDSMDAYMSARKTKDVIADKIRNNPLIQNLYNNGHRTFANKAVHLLVKSDEDNKNANKAMQKALHEMRAEDFFKTLKKVVEELGE